MLSLTEVRKRLPKADVAQLWPVLVLVAVFVGLRSACSVLRQALPPSWYPGTAKLDEAGTAVDDEERKREREADYKPWTRQGWASKVKNYDFIICGGGTTGCVLASRLSEDPKTSVLVLEAGHAGVLQVFSRIPATFSKLFNHPTAAWGFEFEPSEGVRGRRLMSPRGRMLGGCSSINAMMSHRCGPSDFDEIEDLTGYKGFGWSDLVPCFMRSTKVNDGSTWKVQRYKDQGTSGPVNVGYFPTLNQLSSAFIDACESVGLTRRDCVNTNDNDKGTIGTTRIATLIDKGSRVSTATAYLTPEVIARPNLTVVGGATVTRILFSDDETPRAVGVEYTPLDRPYPSVTGFQPKQLYRASVKRDVLVTSGSIGTPHLLQVSGVGPAKELERLGIKVVSDVPDVGKHLKDHLATGMFYVAQESTSLQWLSDPVKSLSALVEWLRYQTGALTTNIAEAVAFLRSDDEKLAKATGVHRPADVPDLTSRHVGPDIEVICGATAFARHGTLPAPMNGTDKDFFAIAPILLRPKSEGTVTIKSKDIFVKPVIDAQFLSHEQDVKMLMYGTKLCQAIAASAPLAKLLIKPFNPHNAPQWPTFPFTSITAAKDQAFTDEELGEWVRRHAEVLYHPVGTVRLGPLDKQGCLNERLQVHGTHGLRVCDASIFPEQLSGHPMMPLIAIAEAFAERLKNGQA
ncbi:hypothetical protein OIV83_005173 [Microbotryomycetes sp. JL201]|nr:hypothetical protein OIV83_005173 [Microbotryomycetes sp. JL201]